MRRRRAKVRVTIAGWVEHAALMGALSTPPIKCREHNTLCHHMSARWLGGDSLEPIS
jgi:hypothetical protein